MGPYSTDLRRRVVAAYQHDEGSMRELGDRFALDYKTVFEWVALARQTGGVAPRPHGGGVPPRLDDAQRAALCAHVDAHNDATLAELQQWLRDQHRIVLSVSRLSRLLTELDRPRKRRPSGRTSASARR
jgi:transposase